MSDNNEKIVFTTEDGEAFEFFVLEETKINGKNYLLVADEIEGEEANALILADVSEEESEEAVYEVVEDEEQLAALSKVFTELMEDLDIEING
ncbi:DUF1292 domain-containing protein [Anaeromicropila populeti]|uniref:DUF1292 domain-containing protein n=1 Tax=Anaeromicropila populeti TaxID=37658 RepID=A0A1I6IPE9_9FIRM|nr:DUF1292 domain-containing protein [Anaeromicropila populeti]SFR68608.1 Protein of unknown function [Anaeromicropila populeti]